MSAVLTDRHPRGPRSVAFRLLTVLILGACLAVPGQAQTDAEPSAVDAAPTGDRRPSYRVGIEDVLEVRVWGEEDLTITTTVRPDGKITIPLAGDIEVVGKTPEDIAARITEKLVNFLRSPNVTVIVDEIKSFRVYFLGEVNTQGVIQLYQPTRLLQAVALAGGMTEFAKKEIVLVREVEGEQVKQDINYKRMASGESLADNIYLKPGDLILAK